MRLIFLLGRMKLFDGCRIDAPGCIDAREQASQRLDDPDAPFEFGGIRLLSQIHATHPALLRFPAAGLMLGVWTVDAQGEMRRLAALGVDEITTDRPDVARQLFDGEAA